MQFFLSDERLAKASTLVFQHDRQLIPTDRQLFLMNESLIQSDRRLVSIDEELFPPVKSLDLDDISLVLNGIHVVAAATIHLHANPACVTSTQ